MSAIDDDMSVIFNAVGGDAGGARVVYENDFSSSERQGRSGGPRGRGPLSDAADCICPFHYRVVVDRHADGSRSARFPTRREQPGGGEHYCWFQSAVVGRGPFLQRVTAWQWTIRVPTSLDLTSRCSYYENRYVASIGVENRVNHLGVRFDGNEQLVWTRGHQAPDERVLDVIPLNVRLVGGERLRLTLGVNVGSGRSAFAVRDDARGIAVSVQGPTVDLTAADSIAVSSSGNHLDTDEDTAAFFALADVVVAQSDARAKTTVDDVEPVVPPGRR